MPTVRGISIVPLGPTTKTVSEPESFTPAVSLTSTVKVYFHCRVGVPEMVPFGFKLSPGGSVPETIVQL